MKLTKIIVFIICFLFALNTSAGIVDAYQAEDGGYFCNPRPVLGGIIATDNYANALYFIANGKVEKLLSAPGCGRYYTVSPSGLLIGFKLIANGLQSPALFNLSTRRVSLLHEPVPQCGQPSFGNGNVIAFTVGNNLHIKRNDKESTYNLGTYANMTPVSPNAQYAVYNSTGGELFLYNCLSDESVRISPAGKAAVYPRWSPDGTKIMFQSEHIFVYDILSAKTFGPIEGLGPDWSPDSKNIVFYRTETNKHTVVNSDIYMSSFDGSRISRITNTPDVHEMQPAFGPQGELVFHTYTGKTIASVNTAGNASGKQQLIYAHKGPLAIDYFSLPSSKAEVRIPGTVPYVHQVYDTRDDHYGHGSCAPATSVMAFAYYNRLPPWPTQCSSPYPHTNMYGAYISQKYTLNTYLYDDVEQTSGGDNAYGGYGYMWGLGSPNSKMRDYTAAHYFTSVQYWTSSCTITKTRDEIDDGFPHSMCVMLTSSGHLILCRGYVVGQHTLIFSDPYGNKNTPGYPSYDGHEAYYDWPGYNNGYQNLDYNGSYGNIAWTVTNQGNHTVYNDTIIDDVYYNNGFEVNNSLNGSHQRYYHDANTGYNNHMWYTYTEATNSDICWVKWHPTLPVSGRYEVFTYIPTLNAKATGARYKVKHAGGDTVVVINQSLFNDVWVSLGTFNYDTAMPAFVYLGDSTGITGQKIAFDAVKWSYKPLPQPTFSIITPNICAGQNAVFLNTSQHTDTAVWSFPGGSPISFSGDTVVVQYDTAGVFDVAIHVSGSGGTDSLWLSAAVNVQALPVAAFAALDTAIMLPLALAAFTNLSLEADAFLWDFGNGTSSTDVNPYCIYDTAGYYTVTLSATSSCGIDSIVKESYVHVLNASAINEPENNAYHVFPNPFGNKLNIHIPETSDIALFDAAGRLLIVKTEAQGLIHLNTQHLPQGMYILQVKSGQKNVQSYMIEKAL